MYLGELKNSLNLVTEQQYRGDPNSEEYAMNPTWHWKFRTALQQICREHDMVPFRPDMTKNVLAGLVIVEKNN